MIEKNGYSFLVGAITHTVPNRMSSISQLKRMIKQDGFSYASVLATQNKNKIQASWSDDKSVLHYAGGVYRYLSEQDADNYLFVEEVGAATFAYVRVDNNEIISEELQSTENLSFVFQDIQRNDESAEIERQVFLLNVSNSSVRIACGKLGVISDLDDDAWDYILENHLEEIKYKTIHEAVKNKAIRRPHAAAVWGVIGACTIGYFAYGQIETQEIEEFIAPPTDHFQLYREQLTNSKISPTNRLKEDFNLLLILRAIPGWELISVEHMTDIVSYNVRPVMGVQGANTITNLRNFARRHNLQVARVDNSYSLLYVPQNIPVYRSDVNYIHNVEQVTDILIDSVRLWIPGAQVIVHDDQPQGGGRWRNRNIAITFSGHFREDFLTLSSIIEALELPIALNGGDYQVRDEQVSGQLNFSIIGD